MVELKRARRLVGACVLWLAWGFSACHAAPPPRLLLLVTVDTLRADEIGAYGSARGLTPHVDQLAGDAVVFERAYAVAPLTLPSVASILTGRYPEALGIRTNESAVPESVGSLATELSSRGWRTGAVVGNFVLRESAGLARGFEVFDDDFPQREAVRRWPERTAVDTTDAALSMLDECAASSTSRCFLWVHYQDPHGPYEPPEALRELQLAAEGSTFEGRRELPVGADSSGLGALPDYQLLRGRRDVAFYRAGYRAEIAYMDRQLGRLLTAVDEHGLGDRSVVVFAADHGESLGEGNVWFSHGARLTDEQVRVPLMVRAPGRAPARRADPVSLVDLHPTLLALLAEPPFEARGPGRDLLAAGADRGASRAYMSTLGAAKQLRIGLVSDGYKFVASRQGNRFRVALYTLGQEDVDLAAAAPQLVARFRGELEEVRVGLVGVPENRQEFDDETRERLRALGYAEPDS